MATFFLKQKFTNFECYYINKILTHIKSGPGIETKRRILTKTLYPSCN